MTVYKQLTAKFPVSVDIKKLIKTNQKKTETGMKILIVS